METCEYEMEPDEKHGWRPCGAPASWACDIGGGRSTFCTEHKELCEEGEENQLAKDDPRRTPFYLIRSADWIARSRGYDPVDEATQALRQEQNLADLGGSK